MIPSYMYCSAFCTTRVSCNIVHLSWHPLASQYCQISMVVYVPTASMPVWLDIFSAFRQHRHFVCFFKRLLQCCKRKLITATKFCRHSKLCLKSDAASFTMSEPYIGRRARYKRLTSIFGWLYAAPRPTSLWLALTGQSGRQTLVKTWNDYYLHQNRLNSFFSKQADFKPDKRHKQSA